MCEEKREGDRGVGGKREGEGGGGGWGGRGGEGSTRHEAKPI